MCTFICLAAGFSAGPRGKGTLAASARPAEAVRHSARGEYDVEPTLVQADTPCRSRAPPAMTPAGRGVLNVPFGGFLDEGLRHDHWHSLRPAHGSSYLAPFRGRVAPREGPLVRFLHRRRRDPMPLVLARAAGFQPGMTPSTRMRAKAKVSSPASEGLG